MRSYVLGKLYEPGERVPETGIYQVLHRGHRAPHANTIFRDEIFPPCKQCGQEVRFQFVIPMPKLLISPHYCDPIPSLLILDAQKDGMVAVREALEESGYSVEVANNGTEAMDLLQTRDFDAVIADLDAQVRAGGLDVARAAKSMQPAPVVV